MRVLSPALNHFPVALGGDIFLSVPNGSKRLFWRKVSRIGKSDVTSLLFDAEGVLPRWTEQRATPTPHNCLDDTCAPKGHSHIWQSRMYIYRRRCGMTVSAKRRRGEGRCVAEGGGKRREGRESWFGGLKELLVTSPGTDSKFPVSCISPCLVTHGVRLLCEGNAREGMISLVRPGLHGRNGNV